MRATYWTIRAIWKPFLLVSLLALGTATVWAENPPGCTVHREGIDLGVLTPVVVNGDVALFAPVEAFNNVGRTDGCDIDNAVVQFYCPDETGQPDLDNPMILSGPGGDDLPAEFPGTILAYPTQACTINVNPGVTTATALLVMGDINTPPTDTSLGVWRGPVRDEPFGIQKPITVNVLTCDVEVDKQVSCDGGLTWLDVPAGIDLNSWNDDGTNFPCAGLNAYTTLDGALVPADDILVRYRARNTGSSDLFECVIEDSNPGLPGAGVGIIPPGATTGYTTVGAACSEDLAAGEPDTATATCFCTDDLDPGFTTSAFDEADFTCRTPGLEVVKTCLESDALGANEIEIRITNTGDVGLEDCVIVDELFTDDDTCPADAGAPTLVPLSHNFIDLAAGDPPWTVTGTIADLEQDACNQARVSCDIVGSDKSIVVEDDDLCTAAEVGVCVVIIDEDGIDNDMRSIENEAYVLGVEPDRLINDDRPTEVGNPPFLWNETYPGSVVLLPTGQVDDEGWYALPEGIPWPLQDFVDGVVPQDRLDKIADVMPLRNQDLARLVGRTCVAVVYDSDISMNYHPINANLQGARYGLFSFTVLGLEVPGSLPESQSSTSLYDLWLRVEPPMGGDEGFLVTVRDHEPDAIEIVTARYLPETDRLLVIGESDFAPGAFMTVSVDGPDAGTDLFVDPFVVEAPMVFSPGAGTYQYSQATAENLVGRRILISTDEGGSYNDYIECGESAGGLEIGVAGGGSGLHVSWAGAAGGEEYTLLEGSLADGWFRSVASTTGSGLDLPMPESTVYYVLVRSQSGCDN